MPASNADVSCAAGSGATHVVATGAPSDLPPPTGAACPVKVTSGSTPASGSPAGGVTVTRIGVTTPGGITARTGAAVQPLGTSTDASTSSGSFVQLPAETGTLTGWPATTACGTVSAVALTCGTSTGTPIGMNSATTARLLRAPVTVKRSLRTLRAGVFNFAVFISSAAPHVLVRTVVNVVPSVLAASVYAVM